METVGAALKKGQIPYVDFYPLKGTKKNDYIIINPNKKIDLESNRQDTWDNVFKMAKELYDEPIKAMDVLLRGSKMTEKENKDLALNKLVDKNLESYCMFIGVPYDDINKSVREFQTVPDTKMDKKYHRQQIIDRIVEKHRRLVKQKPKEFKKWLRDNEEYYLGPY